jgi:Na+-translocating ferredoxin:NAD+ oxidoreductase RnfD subunit
MTLEAQTISAPSIVTPPEAVPSLLQRFFSPKNRYLAPLLITLILLVAQLHFGLLEGLDKTGLAIVISIAAELALGWLVQRRLPHLASAYITGISVGIILRSPMYWPYALCSAISIVSKYALRIRGRHLFNPSNFGVSAMFFLYAAAAAPLSVQWGNEKWAVLLIWFLGCIIVGRLRRFHITLSYIIAFVIFAGFRARMLGQPFLTEVTPITSAPYQLFIFFMITDPGTTVRSKWGQCVAAVVVACVESFLRMHESIHAPYYALFLVFPIANLMEMALKSRPGVTKQ